MFMQCFVPLMRKKLPYWSFLLVIPTGHSLLRGQKNDRGVPSACFCSLGWAGEWMKWKEYVGGVWSSGESRLGQSMLTMKRCQVHNICDTGVIQAQLPSTLGTVITFIIRDSTSQIFSQFMETPLLNLTMTVFFSLSVFVHYVCWGNESG